MRQFREALDDVNVRVSEQTLLEVGRYFQAPTLKDECSQRKKHETGYGNALGERGNTTDCALVEISYVPLMDIVFGRKTVRNPSSREFQSEGDKETDHRQGNWDEKSGDGLQWREKETSLTYSTDAYDDNDIGVGYDDDVDDRCYVNVDRIRAARVAVIEATDGLARPPLFLAAAAGVVPTAKILIQHGAESALAVSGTDLTPYSVAPSLTMKRVLAAEARQSLYRAVSERISGDCHGDVVSGVNNNGKDGKTDQHAGLEVAGGTVAEPCCDITRRMEMWVSTLAEGELQSDRSNETRVDQKTSLHLAAIAGLPEAVKSLLGRGIGKSKDGATRSPLVQGAVEMCSARPSWITSWKPCYNDIRLGDTRVKSVAHSAFDNHSSSKHDRNLATLATDANGWSPLHSCCAKASPQHYSCVVSMLGSNADPNARTNTGTTPLHVAANACGSTVYRSGVSGLHNTRMDNSRLHIAENRMLN